MDNKFDLKKFLAENKGTTVSESTELVKGKNFTFNRFAAGDGKMGLQISNNSKIGEYIHIPGALLGEFGLDFEKARAVFDDTKRQLPVDEEAYKLNEEERDFTDTGMVTPHEEGYLTIDSEDIEDPENLEKQTKVGDIVTYKGNTYIVVDEEYFDSIIPNSDNHLLVRI